MRVWTKAVSRWDDQLQRYVTVEAESSFYEYDGPAALLKGDDTAKQTELLAQQNTAQQLQFSQQLMGIFTKQFAKQQDVLDYLQSQLKPMIDNPTGYGDAALTAMRTSSTDTIAQQYQSAQRAIQEKQYANGGRDLPSGVDQQVNAAIASSMAQSQAGAQNEITVADQNLKQQNYWAAVNGLTGNAAMINPQSYASSAQGASSASSGAANATANLSQAVTASQQSGLMSMLGGLGGAALGAAGQSKGGFAGLFGCWVAAAVFEEDFYTGRKTGQVRNWLWQEWYQHWYAKPVLYLYARYGKWISTKPILVRALAPLFNAALRHAQEQQ